MTMTIPFALLAALVLQVSRSSATTVPETTIPNFELCARYSVWLDKNSTDLVPYNDFFIKKYVIDRSVPGEEKMRFHLPEDLTAGQKTAIILTVKSQDGAKREFEGHAGKATCEGPWKRMSCNFKFNPLKIADQASAKYLTTKYGDGKKRDALYEIAVRFGGDPIGVAIMAPRDARCFAN